MHIYIQLTQDVVFAYASIAPKADLSDASSARGDVLVLGRKESPVAGASRDERQPAASNSTPKLL